MNTAAIKSKIESLSRMTVENGCTVDEAQNAAAMAQRLRAKLPPEAPRRQAPRPQPPQDHHVLWEMFRQAMDEPPIYVRQHAGDPWDRIREQSVLDDLDAFLGNQGTRRGTGGSFWSSPPPSRADEARRQYNERTLRDKIRAGKVRF